MKKIIPFVFGFILLGLVYSCHPPPEYPVEPHIEFKSVINLSGTKNGVTKDSIITTIRFEDGDGDLGLSGEDVKSPPYNQANNDINFLVESFLKRKSSTTFEKINLPSASGRFFRLNPDNRVGPLEGDLRWSINVPEFNPVFNIVPGDQIKFRIKIRDRALHESNMVETTPVVIEFKK